MFWIVGGGIKKSFISRLDKVSCHTRKLTTVGCHVAHRLFGAWEAGATVHQGPGGGAAPITFCIRCGCYSSTRMVNLKHKCIVGIARSKRLRAKKHPSSKAPLVGVHRIIMDRSSIAEEVSGSQNPGVHPVGSLNPGMEQGQPEEPQCPSEPWQDPYPEMEEARKVFFECDLHEDENLEAARAFGLLG